MHKLIWLIINTFTKLKKFVATEYCVLQKHYKTYDHSPNFAFLIIKIPNIRNACTKYIQSNVQPTLFLLICCHYQII